MNNQMAINTYLSTFESKTQNKQAEQKQNHRYRKCFDGCQMGGDQGDEKIGEGIEKYTLVVTEESWGCKVQHRK